jgi:hypothetical protein
MKKIILLFSVVLALFSCSKSDENTTTGVDPNKILLKKAVNEDFTLTYLYEGNKLIRIDSKEVYITNNYTGNLITSGGQYYTKSNNKIVETFYEYDSSNRLISDKSILHQQSIVITTIYKYNTDGTVSYESYGGGFTNQNTPSGMGKFWLDNKGQTLKQEQYDEKGKLIQSSEYTYDDKNGVFKNVLGYEKLNFSLGNRNNEISGKTYDANGVITYSRSQKITYNEYNFPSTVETTFNNGAVSNVQYFYE